MRRFRSSKISVHLLYGESIENRVMEIHNEVRSALAGFGESLISQFSLQAATIAVEKITPDIVASALSRRVLVTRPASREELRSGKDVVAVRQANRNEL